MGRSSPPFLYDRPNSHSFHGPNDPGFNPKAVTQASRTRVPPRPEQKGPLLDFNRHPDSWGSVNKSTWTPMSPNTKKRVKYVRGIQLALRVITLLGALASLFCAVVIKDVAMTVIWIIRAGPIVAILHTIYGIYHLSRSPITRPPASQAAYGIFASTVDVGLVPFYVFTAFMAHAQWTQNAYNWSTLFQSNEFTVSIAEATFICAAANAGLHFVSLCLSIFLAVIFRKISNLPPDMNPLEDNLTARPKKCHNRVEKHMSSSTLNSHLDDPLLDPPRIVPFMHTRGQSLAADSDRGSMDPMSEKRQSEVSAQPHRFSHVDAVNPEVLFHQPASQPYDMTTQTPAPEYRSVVRQMPAFVDPSTYMRHLTSRTADRSNSVSPLSNNWVTYSDRSPSPMDDPQNQHGTALRQSSSVYSRRTDATGASTGSGIRDWFAYGQKTNPTIGSVIPEDARGEYASLAANEYYGNDEDNRNHEQDLGDRRFNIFPDPAEHDHDSLDEATDGLPVNPLMLNPPTPQPALPQRQENTDPVRRVALSDNPNLSYNPKAQVAVPLDDPGSPTTQFRFYGDLGNEFRPEVGKSRDPSSQEELINKPTKLTKKRSKKMSAYQSLKKDDSDDEGQGPSTSNSPAMKEGDRKGRIVSNSGTNMARPGIIGGVGASLSSYGSYIAGLGVGRRRDVSGKMAEEGRGKVEERPNPKPTQGPAPIRAAGWARFAGL